MQRQKWRYSSVCAATILFVAAAGVIPYSLHASKPGDQKEIAPVASGGVLEGRVIEAETLTLVVEKVNGEIVRVPMPGKSGDSSADFAKGDYIEVAISPEGITTSVRKIAKTEN